MSLQSQLSAAAQQKLSKELEAREEALNERENLLDSAEQEITAKLAIVESKIDLRNKELSKLEEKIVSLKKSIITLDDDLDQKQADFDVYLDKLHLKRDIEDTLLIDLRKEADKERDNLERVSLLITERAEYLDLQEETVNATIEGWNVELRDLQREVALMVSQKEDLLKEVTRIEQKCITSKKEIIELTDKLDSLHRTFNQKLTEYRDKLSDIKIDLDQKQKESDEFDIRNSMKLQKLETRERSVITKELANIKTDKELNQKRQKLEMDYGIAGLKFE